MVEYKVVKMCIYKLSRHKNSSYVPKPAADADVEAHCEYVRSAPEAELRKHYSIVVKNMTKQYNKTAAVKGLCFVVKQYECFGILGLEGAGKSTVVKILIGDVTMTAGDAWVDGCNVQTEQHRLKNVVGYCPESVSLPGYLNPKQVLKILCLIRGVPVAKCQSVIERICTLLDLRSDMRKKIMKMTDGNKRKLCIAMALIGDPPILYLVNPTAGLEPQARQHLWNVFRSLIRQGRCILLTSDSVEECEAVCTKMAIMVNGKFRCYGPIDHLKKKFASGCTLVLRASKYANQEDISLIEKYVKNNIQKAELREKHNQTLSYYIDDRAMPWSKLFGIMEKAKNTIGVEDYTLGQSSLEQVILNLLTRFKFICCFVPGLFKIYEASTFVQLIFNVICVLFKIKVL